MYEVTVVFIVILGGYFPLVGGGRVTPCWLSGKESACNAGNVSSLGWEDLLENEMATHSSIFIWEIPWTEQPGGL